MSTLSDRKASAAEQALRLLEDLRHWPWLDTLKTLRERFREDHLSLSASSLTFTTLIALVPLVTVMLAVFSAFPVFGAFQGALEKYFLQALVPDGIARPVMRALTQFASKASGMGSLGLLLLCITALAMVFTIDRTLNQIWRVRRPRPLGQRVMVYWAALTLGPLLLGVSLTMTSYAVSASRGFVNAMPGGLSLLLNLLEFGLLSAALAALFRYVPNTFVRWRHAMAGALAAALGLELAKAGLAWYVQAVPSFSMIYGAFATLPILLLWIYLVWVIVLLGAVVAAYAPSLQMGLRRTSTAAGSRFDLALDALRELRRARVLGERGRTLVELAAVLRLDPLQIETAMEVLAAIDWVGRLDEPGARRYVLLCEPTQTPARALIDALLLTPSDSSAAFRRAARIDELQVADLLGS